MTLQRYRGDETHRLLAAVSERVEHLGPWMPWVSPDPSYDGIDEFVSRAMVCWTTGEAYSYWFSCEGSIDIVGAGGLHRQAASPSTLEIGYWVHARFTRRGIARTAAAARTNAGLVVPGVDRVEIRCDEANVASAAVPRSLGYRLEGIVEDPITAPGEIARCMIWATDASSWSWPYLV